MIGFLELILGGIAREPKHHGARSCQWEGNGTVE